MYFQKKRRRALSGEGSTFPTQKKIKLQDHSAEITSVSYVGQFEYIHIINIVLIQASY
jgi:hypothetical protein